MTDKVKVILELDPEMKVSEMTVGQFLEAVTFRETAERARETIATYKAKAEQLESINNSSKEIFKNVTMLTSQSTPFELRNNEDVEKFTTMLKQLVVDKKTVVIAMAIKG